MLQDFCLLSPFSWTFKLACRSSLHVLCTQCKYRPKGWYDSCLAESDSLTLMTQPSPDEMRECRSAEQKVAGSNPGQTNTQGL